MITGILMLLAPILVFLITLPFSRLLRQPLHGFHRIFGALLVFAGSSVSLYLAAYTGDQGGIAAYFFQLAVIVVFLAFLLVMAALNWLAPILFPKKKEK